VTWIEVYLYIHPQIFFVHKSTIVVGGELWPPLPEHCLVQGERWVINPAQVGGLRLILPRPRAG
jgi:hypothetical protein